MMWETIGASVVVAFISALAYVAYKHPRGFQTIFWVLSVVILLCFILIAAYNLGVSQASLAMYDVDVSSGARDSLRTAVHSKEVPWWTTMAICIGFYLYLTILSSLPQILHQQDDQKAKDPNDKEHSDKIS